MKENIEIEKNTHRIECSKIQEKLNLTEVTIADLGSRFRESEQLNKSLRAVLREKEDLILDNDNIIVNKTQEQLLIIQEYQRKIKNYEEDSLENLARVKLLEHSLQKSKSLLAESDASGLLKDELLTSALTKQARTCYVLTFYRNYL